MSNRIRRKLAPLLVVPVAMIGLAGCSSEPEAADLQEIIGETEPNAPGQVANGADVGPFSGVFDADFRGDIPSYLGSEVTLSAEVGEILTAEALTIVGDDEAAPLLVVTGSEVPELETGQTVEVDGLVREGFDVLAFEEASGVDLEDEVFLDWEGEYYIDATAVTAP
ncbi:hypothetical protein [Arthrobacter sp. H41]|uniref:hypothetical protein n=1 Tax=Arthrobacter sp. H41 TaxID=1312978 RepID=UPI0012DCAD35|nr:hypothetical protein [Arthrobacter sp. H41]